MRLTLEINRQDFEDIRNVITLVNSHMKPEPYENVTTLTSHGPLDLITLTQMLLHDVALTLRRPGSWEAANMQRVIEGHGYSITAKI